VTDFGVSLLSGGLDSTIVTSYAAREVECLNAITFKYGQTHVKEIDCAKNITSTLKINRKVIDISFVQHLSWYSSLTNPDDFKTPTKRPKNEISKKIPITYVPLRNTIFLSLGAAALESEVLNAIENENINPSNISAKLFMAPNAIDYSGYPDCRPEFFASALNTINLGSKLSTEYDVTIEIVTPIIHKTKAEIIQMGMELNSPIELTWSCYDGGQDPCNDCDSCILRARGFHELGINDPSLSDSKNNVRKN
jgi:7-cyano-7-deazaguanine synthase